MLSYFVALHKSLQKGSATTHPSQGPQPVQDCFSCDSLVFMCCKDEILALNRLKIKLFCVLVTQRLLSFPK